MTNWFHRKRNGKAKPCTKCGRGTVRTSRLCRECEREERQRSIDAQRGFSVELAGYVHVPSILTPPNVVGDGVTGTPQD